MNQEAEKRLDGFVSQYHVEFPVSVADRATFLQFAQISVMSRFCYPYLVFIDREGKVPETHQGAERAYFADLESNVSTLVGELL